MYTDNKGLPTLPRYLVLLTPQYLPQQSPILEHPQPKFLHQCDSPSYTFTKEVTNYNYLYFNLYIVVSKV